MKNAIHHVWLRLTRVIGKSLYISSRVITLQFNPRIYLVTRHIDSARYYNNEAEVGRAVRDCGLKREEVFVSTSHKYPPAYQILKYSLASKIYHPDFGFESALCSVDDSFNKFGLGMPSFLVYATITLNHILASVRIHRPLSHPFSHIRETKSS